MSAVLKDAVLAKMQRILTADMCEIVAAVPLQADTPVFNGGLELDSFTFVEFVSVLENNFGVELNEQDFDSVNFRTLESVADLLLKCGVVMPEQ